MCTENTFRLIRKMIAEREFAALRDLIIVKPKKFNWVAEVFEKINVQDHPNDRALIWTDGAQTKTFSFEDLSILCNHFLNFLRQHGVHSNAVIFSQLPLLPENWLTTLVAIKGGFRLVPAATILSVNDIVYRFGKLKPEVVIADSENAAKIDEAEVLSGEFISLKISVNGTRQGWVSFEKMYDESRMADAADTNADDPLFLFF